MTPNDSTPKKALTPDEDSRLKKESEGEGNDANIPGASAEKTKLQIPQEEQNIVVREVGSAGKKLYKNDKVAKPKTALSASDFKKGEATLSEQEQGVPLEYLDIIE